MTSESFFGSSSFDGAFSGTPLKIQYLVKFKNTSSVLYQYPSTHMPVIIFNHEEFMKQTNFCRFS